MFLRFVVESISIWTYYASSGYAQRNWPGSNVGINVWGGGRTRLKVGLCAHVYVYNNIKFNSFSFLFFIHLFHNNCVRCVCSYWPRGARVGVCRVCVCVCVVCTRENRRDHLSHGSRVRAISLCTPVVRHKLVVVVLALFAYLNKIKFNVIK